jgi:hypothetical protein
MITQFVFVNAEIDLQRSPAAMQAAIVAELQKWGEPLRWAITTVNPDAQTVQIEAIVTTQND